MNSTASNPSSPLRRVCVEHQKVGWWVLWGLVWVTVFPFIAAGRVGGAQSAPRADSCRFGVLRLHRPRAARSGRAVAE